MFNIVNATQHPESDMMYALKTWLLVFLTSWANIWQLSAAICDVGHHSLFRRPSRPLLDEDLVCIAGMRDMGTCIGVNELLNLQV